MGSRKTSAIAFMTGLIMMVQVIFPNLIGNSVAMAQSGNLNIQFQSSGGTLVESYLPDYGEEYGTRNGYSYGWNVDHTGATVTGSAYGSPLINSSIEFQSGGIWEIEVADGLYNVEVSVGNSVYDSSNKLYVENLIYWDDAFISAGGEETAEQTVEVADGKLTLSTDETSIGTSVHYLSITPVVPPVFREMTKPHIGLPAEQNKVEGNRIMLSGKQKNSHNALPFMNIAGLDEEIDRYMKEEMLEHEQLLNDMEQRAVACSNCNAGSIESAIEDSDEEEVVIEAGHLNLDASATFGSPSKPVYLILDGINTNNSLTITVYGTLVVKGNLNANTKLNVEVMEVEGNEAFDDGNLWITGTLHLNNDSKLQVEDDLIVDNLTYNSGQPSVEANRLIVAGKLHINTNVEMNIEEEMLAGDIVSNNQTAVIRVASGDLFIRDSIHVNNNLSIETGGIVAIGGDITANQKPSIQTGAEGGGFTKLKYAIYGLKAEYYSETELSGDKLTMVDANVNLDAAPEAATSGLTDGKFSVRWSGQVEPYYSELYRFELKVKGGARLWVDGALLIDEWEGQTGENTYAGSIELVAGERYDIQIDYASREGSPKAVLYWESESLNKEIVPQSQLNPFAELDIDAASTESKIALEWTTAFNADGYELEADGYIYPLGVQNEYTVNGLQAGTLHKYRVRAASGDIKGEWSSYEKQWTLPDVPGNIHMQSTSTSVTLEWDEVTGATGYDIETYNSIADNGEARQYTENNLNPNTQRTYRVRAKNAGGAGQWSELFVKSTIAGVPGNLSATAEDDTITVHWDPVSGAESYSIEIDGMASQTIGTTLYVHGNIAPGSMHTYRVRANNPEGSSEWSSLLTVQALPSVPDHFEATAAASSVMLQWDEAAGALEYELEADGVVISNGDLLTYTHSGLEAGSEHQYRVRSVNGETPGKWSEYISVVTLSSIPANVIAVVLGSTQIQVEWDPVPGSLGYEVEADGQIIQVGLNTYYLHDGLVPFSRHSYRVRALGTGGAGDWSEEVVKTTGLGMPRNVEALSTAASITLSWDPVEGATGYDVLVDGELIDNGSATTYEHRDLTPYSRHVYRIRAKNGQMTGDWSETVTQVTGLGTPQFTLVEPYSTKILLSWNTVTGAAAYEIEVDGKLIDVGTATNYAHTELEPDSEHSYRVRAKNGSAYSEWSDWSSVLTQATAPGVPRNFIGIATTTTVELSWDEVSGSGSYEVEVDGKIVSDIKAAGFLHEELDPNTMHLYRVRSVGGGGKSEWSDLLTITTIPEITIHAGQDNFFNFVIVLPEQETPEERTVTVTYNPDDLLIADLSAVTPETETTVGPIAGTLFTIAEASDGQIVYIVTATASTVINSIRFQAKNNEYTKISYVIE